MFSRWVSRSRGSAATVTGTNVMPLEVNLRGQSGHHEDQNDTFVEGEGNGVFTLVCQRW
jgi:hypothetical protein